MWTRAFSIVKMLPREVTIFPEKNKNLISRFKYYKSMPNIKICLNEVQTLDSRFAEFQTRPKSFIKLPHRSEG